MNAPARPETEALRLAALHRYDMLDTGADDALDDLAGLAARICETPMALISLVDDNRQWFKSRVGLTFDELPREVGFCGHTILESSILVVADAASDARFVRDPLVTADPGIRFYAGTPLRTPDGHNIGALCVMDRAPRTLAPWQMDALSTLGRQVIAQFELHREAQGLAENEDRLLTVFRNCPVAMAIHRWADRTFVDVNEAFTEIMGWTLPELLGRTSADAGIVDANATAHLRAQLEARAKLRNADIVVRTRDGHIRHVIIATELVKLHGEQHVITTFVDITDRRQAELASIQLAAIVESLDDAIIGKDLTGTITSWNSSAKRIFGYATDEIVGTSILRLIPNDRHDEEHRILETIRRGNRVEHFETKRLRKDGRLIDVSVTVSPIKDAAGTVVGVSKVARDVTEAKKAAEAQRASETRYRTLFDYAPDGILIADPESNYIDANPSICRMLGYSREALVGLHALDIVADTETEHIGPALSAVRAQSAYEREWRFKRKDGSVFAADVIATMMPDGNLLGMVRDVTERKRIEARFSRLVDSNVQGVLFWSGPAQTITAANDAFLRIVGYAREDIETAGISWVGMTVPDSLDADRRAREELAARGVCAPYEKACLRKDGSTVSVLIGCAAFDDNPEEGVAFVVDLTDRKKLEAQFLRAQRLESIGTLAGGIAHDINNVLAPILMSVEMLREAVTAPEDLALLTTLQTSAERGAELVKQVLSFARGVAGQRIPVNPAHVMADLVGVMRDTFPKSIDVRFDRAPDLWTVTGDPTQIHQVLLNLCVNARDAMPHGGRLSIAMENIVLDETYASMNVGATPGPHVRIKVQDTGTGIPPEIRERMFEPFFTTKDVGKGTGLGMSTVLAIIKSHGGFINLYSEVGAGTKIKVYIPANATAAEATEATIEQAGLPRGNGEVVLVVDDEESIRNVAKRTLERFGYRVWVAAHGAEAVALYAQHPGEIALVLTDMAMPIMDGPALIVALKSMDPSVRILGSSGLATHNDVAKAVGAGVVHFVPKPYTAETLLKSIQQALA